MMKKKYGAINTWEGDNEIQYIDSDIFGDEYISSYYLVIFEAENEDDFNTKKYRYKGVDIVSVNGVLFRINRRVSKHRYLCEDLSERGVGHIPFFSARRLGNLYVFYDFNFS